MNENGQRSIFDAVFHYFLGVWSFIRAFFGSFFTAFPYLVGMGEFRKEVTEQYPDPISSRTEDDLPPRTRGLLFNDIERCTGCRECERVCPTECFIVETHEGPEASKLWVSTFDIDLSRCVFCGLCVEVCQPQSLVHTRKYEGAARKTSGMVKRFGRGEITPEQREKWAILRKQREAGDDV